MSDDTLWDRAEIAPDLLIYGPDDTVRRLADVGADEEIRKCSQCKLRKIISEFSPGQSWCKRCCADDQLDRYRADPEPKRQAMREHYAANAEQINAAVRQDRRDNPEKYRDRDLKRMGISAAEYDRRLEEQGGVCAICHRTDPTGRALAVDHNHHCCPGKRDLCGNCTRGLLCTGCNTMLGSANDDPQRLRAAIDYLNFWRSDV